MCMRIFPPVLAVLALVLAGCSGGLPFSASDDAAETSADAASSTTESTTDGEQAEADESDDDGNDGDSATDEADYEDVDEDGTTTEGETTIEPRQARNDLTDPYCISLESVFAAAYDIEVTILEDEQSPDFGVHLASYAEAVTEALELAPGEHLEQLNNAAAFANTYANLSYAEAEQNPNFNEDFETWYWLFLPDLFAEDVQESDFEDPAYVSAHAQFLCGIDTEVTYSVAFGGGAEIEFEASFSTELGDLSEYGVGIDDIVLSCTVTGQRGFEVDLSNSLTETLSFSGEVVFFDGNGEPTSGRSTFYATSLRPGERSAEVQDSDDPTSDTCEIDHMSWVRSENVPVEPVDTCSFTFDGSVVDVEITVAGSDQAGDWINVRYGISDADGIRRHSGLATLENDPDGIITGSTFDFTEDERFATCAIVEKELL